MSKFEIYDYALKNPKSSISQSIFRIRRICNRANCVLINLSGGKDSSLDFDLFMNEILFRMNTPPGNFDINENDFDNFYGYYKLEDTNKNIPFIVLNTQDPEIIYTDTRNHIIYDKILPYGFGLFILDGQMICGYDPINIDGYDNAFSYWNSVKHDSKEVEIHLPNEYMNNLVKMGKYPKPRKYKNLICLVEGKGIIHTFYKCLPLAFQNISAFSDETCFISWNKEKKKNWVTNIPNKFLLGCDPITEAGWELKNIIPVSLCPKWMDSDKIMVNGVECYTNWGFGSKLLNRNIINTMENRVVGWSYFGQRDEGSKSAETYTFSLWLLDNVPDMVENVYVDKNVTHPFEFYSIVSIRSEESPNRNMILKQGNYYNGQYGYISSDKN